MYWAVTTGTTAITRRTQLQQNRQVSKFSIRDLTETNWRIKVKNATKLLMF